MKISFGILTFVFSSRKNLFPQHFDLYNNANKNEDNVWNLCPCNVNNPYKHCHYLFGNHSAWSSKIWNQSVIDTCHPPPPHREWLSLNWHGTFNLDCDKSLQCGTPVQYHTPRLHHSTEWWIQVCTLWYHGWIQQSMYPEVNLGGEIYLMVVVVDPGGIHLMVSVVDQAGVLM